MNPRRLAQHQQVFSQEKHPQYRPAAEGEKESDMKEKLLGIGLAVLLGLAIGWFLAS